MDRPVQWALVGAAWFLAVSVALFGYLCWQRLGRVRMAPPPALSAVSAAPATATPPQTAVCPVTGERVTVGPDTPQVTVQGRTYYFSTQRDADGEDARTRFLMNPDAWLKGLSGTVQ